MGSNLRGPATENRNNIGEEASWEVRPGGMLVQKREDVGQEQQGFDGSSFMIKVAHGSNIHDIIVSSTSTFGDVKRVIAREIGVEPEMQKLFFRGKEKADCDYLQMAGVKDDSKMLLVEDTIVTEVSSKEINETSEISRGSEAVAEIRVEVDKLAEKVSALQVVVNGGTKIDEKDIIYVTEMLMRQLLKLDMVDAAGEGKVLRKMEIGKTIFLILIAVFSFFENKAKLHVLSADDFNLAQVRRIQSFVEEMDTLKAKNSNPFSDYNNTLSVSTEWEKFDSGVGSLTAPTPAPPPPNVTQEWERFD